MRRLYRLLAFAAALGLVSAPPATPIRAQDGSVDLKQGWSAADRAGWYDGTQGSRLLPFSWWQALEQPGGTAPFRSPDHIARFRYLPRGDRLPVGFAIDESDDEGLSFTRLRWKAGQGSKEQWLGFNCSACHTAEMTFGGHRLRVDGGPTLADFQGFMETLNRALAQTHDDPQRFARFAARVLGPDDTDINRTSLMGELGKLVAWQGKVERMNATDLRYGFARLDAFGHIYNKVALVADGAGLTPNPSDAPVSYPFLWNVPQHDKVQWNGIAPSKVFPTVPISQPFDVGALARNVGEVIGVFADVKPVRDAGLAGFPSSVQVSSIVSLEQLLGRLKPPAWPSEILGAPDPALVSQGQALFTSRRCDTCHAPLARDDLLSPIKAAMSPLAGPDAPGTDPWMACNAYLKEARSGLLEGTKRGYAFGDPLGPTAQLADMLAATVGGAIVAKKAEALESVTQSFFGRQPPPVVVPPAGPEISFGLPSQVLSAREQRLARCMSEKSGILAYKGRPLTGIWATAPYLHNGSVASLYELLLPPAQRAPSFWLGTRELDPRDVGYVTTPGGDNTWLFRTRDVQGRIIDGNSNLGHDYGNAQLTEQQRRALVEYLKTL